MQKKSQEFSMDEIMRLAKSPAGQQLIAMLQQEDSTTLQQAVTQAQSGNLSQAGQTLSSILSSPEAQQLIKKLGGN